jgi:hypothetical protein
VDSGQDAGDQGLDWESLAYRQQFETNPDIIEKGTIIDVEPNLKGREYVGEVIVHKDKQTQRFYLQELVLLDSLQRSSFKTEALTGTNAALNGEHAGAIASMLLDNIFCQWGVMFPKSPTPTASRWWFTRGQTGIYPCSMLTKRHGWINPKANQASSPSDLHRATVNHYPNVYGLKVDLSQPLPAPFGLVESESSNLDRYRRRCLPEVGFRFYCPHN